MYMYMGKPKLPTRDFDCCTDRVYPAISCGELIP